jgi:hypothetical protein
VARQGPAGVPVQPGTVLVAAEQAGYSRITMELTMKPGEHRHLALTLSRPSAARLGATGLAAAASGTAGGPTTAPLLVAPSARKRPLYKRAWFWGVVGAGAAVAAGAIAVGVVFGTRDRYPSSTLGGFEGN